MTGQQRARRRQQSGRRDGNDSMGAGVRVTAGKANIGIGSRRLEDEWTRGDGLGRGGLSAACLGALGHGREKASKAAQHSGSRSLRCDVH